ncbi:MAG: FtsW/RodA/SpoVE family cell cycle protein [Mycoplasmatales bacterium]
MRILKTLNLKIIIPILILFVLSLVTLSGIIPQLEEYGKVTNPTIFILKQFVGMVFGCIGAFFLYKTDLSKVLKYINWIYWALFIMLFILFTDFPVVGDLFVENINGANGWFKFPIIGITIQPVEFMKIAIIFKLAMISKYHLESGESDKVFIKKYLIYGLIPIIMVFLQPDLGGAILLLVPFVFMLLFSIKNKKLLRMMTTALVASIIIFVSVLFIPGGLNFIADKTPIEMYQLERILAWLYPFDYETGFQLQQSLILIGSAGLFGHGFGYTGIHLPEPHTDVIFSEFTGMFGLIAGAFLIFIYFYLINQFIKVTLKTNEILYKMVVLGFTTLFFIQILENMGMMLGILPITGIVLPFMSYGMSAMMTYLFIIGIFLNIDRRNFW